MNYPKKPMKKILLSIAMLILTLLYTTNAMAATGKIEQDAGPYHVLMQTDPEKLTVNQAGTITLLIKNKTTGQPVTGAKVMMMQSWTTNGTDSNVAGNDNGGINMSSGKDKQGGMTMQGQSAMESMAMDAGTYMLGVYFNQSGQWNQSISISSSLGENTVVLPITVAKSGPNLVLIRSAAGAAVIAVILVAILRRKKR